MYTTCCSVARNPYVRIRMCTTRGSLTIDALRPAARFGVFCTLRSAMSRIRCAEASVAELQTCLEQWMADRSCRDLCGLSEDLKAGTSWKSAPRVTVLAGFADLAAIIVKQVPGCSYAWHVTPIVHRASEFRRTDVVVRAKLIVIDSRVARILSKCRACHSTRFC